MAYLDDVKPHDTILEVYDVRNSDAKIRFPRQPSRRVAVVVTGGRVNEDLTDELVKKFRGETISANSAHRVAEWIRSVTG